MWPQIEVLNDGTLFVTYWKGDKLYTQSYKAGVAQFISDIEITKVDDRKNVVISINHFLDVHFI